MAVALTTEQRTALQGPAIAIRVLADFYLGSGRYSFWDGVEHMSIGGQEYLAAGAFASITPISFGSDLGAEGIEITLDATRLLSGTEDASDPAELLATIHEEAYHPKRVEVRFAFFSAETGELVLSLKRFAGIIDQIEIREVPPSSDGPGAALMVMRCESVARRYGRREGRTRSHEDHQEIWPGDDFYKFMSASVTAERRILWGRQATPGSTNVGGGGGGGGGGSIEDYVLINIV
jgi:hypothetical protein